MDGFVLGPGIHLYHKNGKPLIGNPHIFGYERKSHGGMMKKCSKGPQPPPLSKFSWPSLQWSWATSLKWGLPGEYIIWFVGYNCRIWICKESNVCKRETKGALVCLQHRQSLQLRICWCCRIDTLLLEHTNFSCSTPKCELFWQALVKMKYMLVSILSIRVAARLLD